MGSNVEKNIYSLDKNYVEVTFSKKRPPLDFEFNELQKIQNGLREQANKALTADGPYGDGFLVRGTGNPNELRIHSGYLNHKGVNLYLPEDIILSSLTTPSGSDRTDIVYIEWHIREVDSSEDPNIIDVTNVGFETAVRQKLDIEIIVAEGGFIPAPAVGYHQYQIAVLNRLDGVAIVDNLSIQDMRIISGLNYVITGGKVLATGGLNYDFEGATGLVAGGQFGLANSTSSIGANETRYMYVSNAEVLTLASSLPTTYHVPLARITSDATDITEIVDLRRFAPIASGGGGDLQTIFTMTALNPVAQYQVVRITGVNTVDVADASAIATIPVWGIALDAGGASDLIRVATAGVIENSSWSFIAGDEIYASETAGEVTATAPSTLGSVVQKLGIAMSPTSLYFNPDLTYDVVGGIAAHAQNTDIGTTNDEFTLRLGQGPMGTPSGFFVDPGGAADAVGVRYNGTYWEFTNDGTTWEQLGASNQGFRYNTTGDGATVLFTLPQAYTTGGNHLLVFAGTTLMTPTVDYTETSPTQVTFTAAPLNGETLSFIVPNTGNTVLDASLTPAFDTDTGDGIQDTYTLSNAPIPASVTAVVNGVTLTQGLDYTISSNQITFTTTPPNGDIINVQYFY